MQKKRVLEKHLVLGVFLHFIVEQETPNIAAINGYGILFYPGVLQLTDGDNVSISLPLQLVLDTPLTAEGDLHVLGLLIGLPVVHKLNIPRGRKKVN